MAPKHIQLQIFIQADITIGKKIKTWKEQPHLVSDGYIKVLYKTTPCPRQPLLVAQEWSLYTGLTIV